MALRIVTINAGSTSLKVECYDLATPIPPLAQPPPPSFSEDARVSDAAELFSRCFATPADAVAHRMVYTPASFLAVQALDAASVRALQHGADDAPLHSHPALNLVGLVSILQPTIRQYAVADSAFHRTLPPPAQTYALPRKLTEQGLRRIGYHGLSHEYAASRGAALAGIDITNARIITAHLGGGSSLCAIRNGESIDTTMGFTPLDGVPMATRSGAVDPGLLVHLLKQGMTVSELDTMLERESGLLGISGISGDVRTLLDTPEASARLALDVFCWRVRASIGACIASLGGLDLLVFTGGIGEHAATIRERILEGGLGYGLSLDPSTNAGNHEGCIHGSTSGTPVVIVNARENWQLARQIANAVSEHKFPDTI